MCKVIKVISLWVLIMAGLSVSSAKAYQDFKVAVYCRAQEVNQMGDANWIETRWNEISRQVHVDKVYLETHRDIVIVPEETMRRAKKFFADRGVETAGGITYTVMESNRFQTFCYTKPESRKRVKEIAEYTAKQFDEVILDDFFFTNCKCDSCIKAKGNKSWSEFRVELMRGAAKDLVVGPAKKVNPKIKFVIKFPNWYEHFQGCGFDLEGEPKIFDGIYTGTETRDPIYTDQHLQQYESYLVFRYFENIKPGHNGGGWVDTGAMRYMDRYAEQLWLTIFSKAPEITLFDFRQMVSPIREEAKAAWQGPSTGSGQANKTSFDFDDMMKPIKLTDGTEVAPSTMARAAGYSFEQIDSFIGKLGKPVGIKSYKPFHSVGEDFLHNYFGMCGVAMDLQPEFPKDANIILLTESAKFDNTIVKKIKGQLEAGKSVMITSGLYKALQGKGIETIVELRIDGEKAETSKFWSRRSFWGRQGSVYESKTPIIIPEIKYLTNDSWEEISCIASGIGYPILHSADYSKGKLYILTIPDNFGDLYNYPSEVLNQIREVLMKDIYVRIEGPSQVAIFVYDNDTFIVESFHDEPVDIKVIADKRIGKLRDLVSNEEVTGELIQSPMRRFGPAITPDKIGFGLKLKPHSFRVFKGE